MRPNPRWRLLLAPAVCVPLAILWVLLLARGAPRVTVRSHASGAVGTAGTDEADRRAGAASPAASAAATGAGAIADLRARGLRVPIDGADVERWKGSFEETHSGHRHEAVDILAPRDTPIHAVSDGRIAKLFVSRAGGLTVYEIDPSGRYIFYYAHLDRYAEGLHDGDAVTRGQVIGHVGTSGNAPPDTPHLHFTIFRVADPKRWWEGTALDPYEVYAKR